MMRSWQAGLLQGCGSAHEVTRVGFLIMCSKLSHGREISSRVKPQQQREEVLFTPLERGQLILLKSKPGSTILQAQLEDHEEYKMALDTKNDHFSSKFCGMSTATFAIHSPPSTLFSLLMIQSWLQMQQNLSATAARPKASLAYYSSWLDEGR